MSVGPDAGPSNVAGHSVLRDRTGCLTPAGVQAIAAAPAGRAPAELAAHLASCPRCQERVLAADRPASARPKHAQVPPPWRIAVVLGAAFLLLISLLWTLHWLRTQ